LARDRPAEDLPRRSQTTLAQVIDRIGERIVARLSKQYGYGRPKATAWAALFTTQSLPTGREHTTPSIGMLLTVGIKMHSIDIPSSDRRRAQCLRAACQLLSELVWPRI
jgi:hypothetical protein